MRCAADLLLLRRDRDEMVTNFIHKEKERRIQLQSTLPNLIYKRQDSISTVSTKLGPFASFSSKMFVRALTAKQTGGLIHMSETLGQRDDDGQIKKRLTSICDGR